MKKWFLQHILSTALCCVVLIGCTAEEDIPDMPGAESKVMVSFMLDLPSARSSSDAGTDNNYYWERYIGKGDIRAFVYKDDKFQEEVKGLNLEDMDDQQQNETRKITGMLTNDYDKSDNLRLVVLTNMNSRGVKAPASVAPGSSPEDLYEQLVFDYTEAWTFSEEEINYIPMWGISQAFQLTTTDGWNEITDPIYMYRSVAKIDIEVNDGAGLGEGKGNFTITKMELCNVPNMGYCASLLPTPSSDAQFGTASCPPDAKAITDKNFTVYTAEPNSGPTTKIENKIYLPEIATYQFYPNYFYIKVTATIYNESREYVMYMRNNQTDLGTGFDIVRNHKYIINIHTVTSTDQIVTGYAVNPWGSNLPIDLPEFN